MSFFVSVFFPSCPSDISLNLSPSLACSVRKTYTDPVPTTSCATFTYTSIMRTNQQHISTQANSLLKSSSRIIPIPLNLPASPACKLLQPACNFLTPFPCQLWFLLTRDTLFSIHYIHKHSGFSPIIFTILNVSSLHLTVVNCI